MIIVLAHSEVQLLLCYKDTALTRTPRGKDTQVDEIVVKVADYPPYTLQNNR